MTCCSKPAPCSDTGWFLGLNIMDHSFGHSVFAKNRQRLLEADVAREFLLEIVEQARTQRLLSEDHFGVDGTLLEAWASVKSFRTRAEDDPPSEGGGRNPEVDFRGERRSNDTHRSTTDPDAGLAKKGQGKEAKLCFGAHVLMGNREGLVVDVRLTPANGIWEREAALEMLGSVPGSRRIQLGLIGATTPGASLRDAGNLGSRSMWPRSRARPLPAYHPP